LTATERSIVALQVEGLRYLKEGWNIEQYNHEIANGNPNARLLSEFDKSTLQYFLN